MYACKKKKKGKVSLEELMQDFAVLMMGQIYLTCCDLLDSVHALLPAGPGIALLAPLPAGQKD